MNAAITSSRRAGAGGTPTHAMFVELKEPRPGGAVAGTALGPGAP
jgi:hypothetical protein